jgi:hypothetical protein
MSYSQTIANWELPGITLKRVAPTNGGEYVSPCPDCGGDDRFHVWPNEGSNGRFWCRQCGKSGDMIEFLRWQKGMSFKEACESVGKHLPQRRRIVTDTSFSKNSPTPVAIQVKPHKRIKNDLSWLKPKKPEEYKFIPQPLEAERTNQQIDESINPIENRIEKTPVDSQVKTNPPLLMRTFSKKCKTCVKFDIEYEIAWCFSDNVYRNQQHLRFCPGMQRPSFKPIENKEVNYSIFD